MEKHIMGENGINDTLGEDGLYYPDGISPRGDWSIRLGSMECCERRI